MAIFDIFKKKKPKKKTARKMTEAEPLSIKPLKAKKPAAHPRPKKISETAFRVLRGPQVTEKATDLVKRNQYVFRVFRNVSKQEVKRAIEDVYGVDVVSIKIVNIPKKARRLGRIEGWRKSYKKAIVKIATGQKIEVLPR